MKPQVSFLALLVFGLFAACAADRAPRSSILVANLGRDERGLSEIRRAFRASNPGYDLSFHAGVLELEAELAPLVLFVQGGEALVEVGSESSDATVGDIVLLRPGQTLRCMDVLDLLAFSLPASLPASLPPIIRPDWDPRITDQPGGCATESGAYRRILLTWKPEAGPYLSRSLNAHRVRITDSFTHYHPRDGGFDEFYLVQMTQPDARILTSDAVEAIEARDLTAEEATELFDVTPLTVDDLVYLPRETIHRGLGGVLAQVIAAPGFRPGAEIGVDEHLHALNASLGLEGERAIPCHRAE